jgi:hypothetical protein
VCLGVDGVSMFQSVKFKVIVLLKTQHAPYLIGIHCMAHKTNLAMQSFSSMPMVSKLENMFWFVYGHCPNFPPNGILNLRNLLKLWKQKD